MYLLKEKNIGVEILKNIKLDGSYETLKGLENISICWDICNHDTKCNAISFNSFAQSCYLYATKDVKQNSDKYHDTMFMNNTGKGI